MQTATVTNGVSSPAIVVVNDYDEVFLRRVLAAIEQNQAKNILMKPKITIEAGPYRSHCMAYERSEDHVRLDFYSASRVFGFEHTIDDIARCIASEAMTVN